MKNFSTTLLERSNVAISGASGYGRQTLVFLHGLGGDQRMWHLIAPAFEDQYRIVLLDLLGAGNSDLHAYSPATHGTLDGHANNLLGVMRTLGLHDAVFVGHSVGAIIGILAAIREPWRFAKLVLISPSARFLNETGYTGGFEQADSNELLGAMEGDYYGWSHSMAPVMMGQAEPPELVPELTNSFGRTHPEIARHVAHVTFLSDCCAALPLLTTPTLIVQSTYEVIAPLAVGQYINEHLADSRLVVVETDGHCPHLSAPKETLSAMYNFMHRELVVAR